MFLVKQILQKFPINSIQGATGVGDNSVVEPLPQDAASAERLRVQISPSSPAGPSSHRCPPTCLETESNLDAVYGSRTLMAQARDFSIMNNFLVI